MKKCVVYFPEKTKWTFGQPATIIRYKQIQFISECDWTLSPLILLCPWPSAAIFMDTYPQEQPGAGRQVQLSCVCGGKRSAVCTEALFVMFLGTIDILAK